MRDDLLIQRPDGGRAITPPLSLRSDVALALFNSAEAAVLARVPGIAGVRLVVSISIYSSIGAALREPLTSMGAARPNGIGEAPGE